jgi:hypothetical protein
MSCLVYEKRQPALVNKKRLPAQESNKQTLKQQTAHPFLVIDFGGYLAADLLLSTNDKLSSSRKINSKYCFPPFQWQRD